MKSKNPTERAVIVHIYFQDASEQEDLEECKSLAIAAGVELAAVITGTRTIPHPKYFFGSGKAQEVAEMVNTQCADVVIVNHALSPSQERNIEKLVKCRVLDRTTLILALFAARARTHEGQLQVELAQLSHLSTRLVRGWTHLERQKGGIGLRGPGETQLETDRRLIRQRIKTIHTRLKKVEQQRHLGRTAREKVAMPTVSLVGYTNAGKTSLFNRLTGESLFEADQLFATLDPTLRRIQLPGSKDALIADTVGFIRHLPHSLVAAFRATLEETCSASLLLHVIDFGHPHKNMIIEAVNEVLAEIEASALPQILVYNKIDAAENEVPRIARDKHGKVNKIWLSAKKEQGISLLLEAMSEHLYGDPVYRTIHLLSTQGKLRAHLYKRKAVLHEIKNEAGWTLSIRLSKTEYETLFANV